MRTHSAPRRPGLRTGRHPERLSGLFFLNCPHAGIGARWIAPDHVPEVWYQTFNCLPWSAAMVGASRETCRLYIGHFLSHWAADARVCDKDLERFVDNFMKPGNLQGGFNCTSGTGGPDAWSGRARFRTPPIDVPTRVFWEAGPSSEGRMAWTGSPRRSPICMPRSLKGWATSCIMKHRTGRRTKLLHSSRHSRMEPRLKACPAR